MQCRWTRRGGSRELIVFFNGWGMDETPFACVPAREHDLYMVCDYRKLAPLEFTPFAGYDRMHLIAWSMGVWAAAQVLAGRESAFDSRVALAGTLCPIDDKLGLAPARYETMAQRFSASVLEEFQASMFDLPDHLARFQAARPDRPLAELGEEMLAFRAAVEQTGPPADLYTSRIVTSRDRVFPGRNQLRAWGRDNCIATSWPHFPFYLLDDWADLLGDPGR